MSRTSVLRRLWQPPGRFADRSPSRRISFLELFFDLVFVVIIAELSHRLAADPSWSGLGWYAFLFYAVWSSWTNGTLYYDLHTTDDMSVRVFTFTQMLAVAVMAVYVGDIPGPGSVGFALGYGANKLLLVMLWFRTGLHDPSHRPASIPYSTAYLLSAILFGVSVVIPEPARYWLWAGGLALELVGVIVAFYRWAPPKTQGGEAVIAATPSLIERLGLFVIIVLGEVVVGAVNGMAEVVVGSSGVVIGLLGVTVAIGLWWLYFDLISHRAPRSRRTQLWMYLHLPLVMAIAAGGAGVLNTIEHVGDRLPDSVRWLLVGSLAMAMLTTLALTLVLEVRERQPQLYGAVDATLLLSVAGALLVGFSEWGAFTSLAVMVILLGLPIAAGIVLWLKHVDIGTA